MRFAVSALLLVAAIPAPAEDSPDQSLEFLMGKWIGVAGEKDTPLRAGQGGFSFLPELNQNIVVRYNLAVPKADIVVFESDDTQPGPKYGLTYWMQNGSLNGKFEVAAPGSDFKPFMNWRAKKN
jgi:hypothetical protein